jgi:tetratricopeptide (TPR) repeat protein
MKSHPALPIDSLSILKFGAILLTSLSLFAQSQEAATLYGTVRDPSGKSIAATTIILQDDGQTTALLKALTDAQGNYKFTSLPAGLYGLKATASGFNDANVTSIFLAAGAVKVLDIALEPAKTSPSVSPPSFFDPPHFTVSGVTDTTSLGGHGSNTIVRTREAVAKDAASLRKEPSAAKSEALPDIGKTLRAHLARDPGNAELHHQLAGIEEQLGNSLEAAHEYQRAAELDPSESNLFDWGSELLLHHAPEPAIEVFSNGARRFPRSIRMLVGLGASEFAAGSYDLAVQRLCAASDLNPHNPLPYLFLGKIERGESSTSNQLVEKLHRFVTLLPDSSQANYFYALALWKRRNNPQSSAASFTQIESLLNHALRLDPKFADAYLQLGAVHAAQQDFSKAIDDFQRAVQIQPDMEEAHYRLAQAYRATGRSEQAKSEIQTYQQLVEQSAQNTERERHEIKQFVYTLRDQPPAQHQQ